ncbi:fungal-specific transcription factor domain protein [Aspergillus sclerotioniger CBS 115572]|uniref:Fungal-specific transcription factor domain protein n=1 Tax=Aspergillus sclerotioniger CBS 115572 TaxID=1450535 RepID=A0A317W599_9EURO|nr:fungal-specific transcription factor domain protein [Aspergillus sclerotioniger CBS 115572]PWY80761.1 fungal-specific transcription factor domain protein [Aspergillus sclerotioniger CBS 115572]
MRLHSHGANYVGSVHWAAVLDSISELREHYEEEEARMLVSGHVLRPSPGPRLLYEPVHDTKADLLAAIPVRPVVDRMVARYFNAQGVIPEILHRGRFLREYEKFWQEPAATSLPWIGLLFTLMCITTQYQQSIEDSADPETLMRVNLFREKTIHCLVLSEYTRGGDYVLEALINYLTSEMFLSNDGEIGLWLVQGMLVQLALSLGYHRDPQNFTNITPFAGEMRRRVWAVIVQLDLRLSSEMALPRLLKLQHYDTTEPRNLLDTDFDEATVELPPSRPETEVTPVLYSLAKSRIDQMNGLVSDLVNDTGEHPYPEILNLDRKLQEAEASLPPIFRWQPLSQSFMVPPQIVMHRVLLQLAIQRQIIWLHRKYLTLTYCHTQYKFSRSACVQAAIKILEFQQIVDEETQRDGLLYPVRWMFMSSRLQAVFLLGISILCYYVQLTRTRPDVALDPETGLKMHNLLRSTYPLWLRSSAVSQEARRVVDHLGPLLGLNRTSELRLDGSTTVAPSQFDPPQDPMMPLDQLDWDSYEGK